MPSWKWKEVRKALTSKGFVHDDNTTHEMYRFVYEGKITSIRTMISFGNKKELNSRSPLATRFQQQTLLQNKQLTDFLNCPLSEQDYIEILKSKGKLE